MSVWRRIHLLAVAVLLLAACASNPTQVWLNTCVTYYETLKSVNDALEIQAITPQSAAAQGMKQTKAVLSTVCRADAPPEGVARADIQELLDRQLIELIKIEKGLP